MYAFMKNFLFFFVSVALISSCKQAANDETARTDAAEKVIQETQLQEAQNMAEVWEAEIAPAEVSEPVQPEVISGKQERYMILAQASSLKWHGAKLAYGHHGTIKIPEGTMLTVDGKLKGGTATVDMTSIENTDIEDPGKKLKLETHLKSTDFFSADQYPIAEFVIVSVKDAEGEDGNANISGNLTMKGITHQISFPAKITISNETLAASALFSIDRSKWDVRFGSGSFFEDLGDKLINDEIDLSLNLVAKVQMDS